MKISLPIVEVRGDQAKVSVDIHSNNSSYPLWYEFSSEYLDHLTLDRSDAFLVAMLLECMSRKEPLHVDGAVSASLLMNLPYYMQIMSMRPFLNLHPVEVTSDECRWFDSANQGREIGASFSAGVDAMCTVYDHFVCAAPPRRIDRLAFVNVGTHGKGDVGKAMFALRLGKIREAADAIGLPLFVVESNIDDNNSVRMGDSLCARVVSCILLFQKLFHTYLSPSGNAYADLCGDGITPFCDNFFSTDATRILHDGAQYSRVEKTARIANWPAALAHLNVCNMATPDLGNCSQCTKCVRVMLTADMLGVRSRFEHTFDFSHFQEKKAGFVREMIRKGGTAFPNHFWREIVRFAEDNDYPLFPPQIAVVSPRLVAGANYKKPDGSGRPISAFWRQDANLGDQVTAAVLKAVGFDPQLVPAAEAAIIGGGSILQLVPSEYRGTILGSGFQSDHHQRQFSNARILAVRGRLSAERCRAPQDCLLADLGLLAPRLLSAMPPIRKTLAIVPHYADQMALQLQALAARYPNEIVLVNVRANLETAIQLIASSEYVLSSSLYGLIFADALGKPNCWLLLSRDIPGGAFKYHDYYSAFDQDPVPFLIDGSEPISLLLSNARRPAYCVSDRAESLFELLIGLNR